jgi:hypothetical protein
VRQLVPALAAVLAVAAVPATASAVPPNDNYLASTTINAANGALPLEFHDVQDTSTATTQADIFDPDKNGQPLGGGPPEITTCGGVSYGKTVWYDFQPPTPGGVEIQTAGFDNVVAVYRWDVNTSLITQTVGCFNDSTGPTEDVLLQPEIKRRAHYTVQVGGVGGVGGSLDFKLTWFPDTDGDGVLDEAPDHCPHQKGIRADAGCPPTVRATARLSFNHMAGGIQVTNLVVDHVFRRGVVQVRCGHCGSRVKRRARHAGSVRLSGFVGRVVHVGDFIEVRATQPRTGKGRLRFGAIGRSTRWRVTSSGISKSVTHCLAPGTNRRQRCP